IVVYKSKPGNSEKNRVEALGGEIKRSYGKLKMRTMSVPAKRLKSLAKHPKIEYIVLDEPVSALSMAARKTANLPEQAVANGLYDGSSATVAVLDSGVGDHPDIIVSARIDVIDHPAVCEPYTEFLDGVGNGSDIPVANLKTAVPTGALANFDPQRDNYPGLLIKKGDKGFYETHDSKQQTWISDTTDIVLNGPAQLTLWSAMKDFNDDKHGLVTAYLVDANANGGTLQEIAQSTIYSQPAATWSKYIFDFGDLNYILGPNRYLGIKIVVWNNSEDEMWFAYNSANTPSHLSFTAMEKGAPCDTFGHGTHVSGTIGGDGLLSNSDYHGVAPGADIVSLRVLDEDGQGNTSDIIAGLDWILANGAAYGIDVVNLSLGKAVEESAVNDPLVQAAEAVWDAGYVVVTAAGNYGRDGHFTITSPGNSPKLITVGSLTDEETENLSDDYPSTYSSRGPTLFDHFVKPDFVAPGNRLIAPGSNDSKLALDNPDRIVVDAYGAESYLELSGTSMAAAMTSGAVALMLDKDPSLSP
ncbi:MAG: S8 family peptidase, partial [bacterium]|nr:S8 family peptidase [bacterium]